MTTSPRRLIVGLSMVAALASSACGTGEGSPAAPQRATSHQADLTRAALTEAEGAARAYGQAHLGHFLRLRPRDLEREGLTLADNLSLSIRTNHRGFCIQASNEELPSIHPWARGTVSSRTRTPSSADRCQL